MAPGRSDLDRLTHALRGESERPDAVPQGRHRGGRFTREHVDLDADTPAEDIDEEPKPPVLSIPPAIQQGRFRLGGQAVWGVLLTVALIAAVFMGKMYLSQATAPAPLPVAAQDGSAEPAPTETAEASTDQGAAATATPAPTPAATVVHVIGAVKDPGVYTLPGGSRVVDALKEAGGSTDAAELSRMNLALTLSDGDQIWVPVLGEDPPDAVVVESPSSSDVPTVGQGVASSDESLGAVGLNSASLHQLETIPGVGPVTAGRIVSFREERGPFTSVDQLLDVSGIGEKTLESLRPYVSLD
ncbi:helix-hairpin-helix domain-containing protein [Ornithinimicrobium sp. Arc0846-15]|nr:helix-hairpin-helix domain-containing protein [Ornithinimicrobium laminariae]